MDTKKILLITFPVDLGNRTIESNFNSIFENDMHFFRFAPQHSEAIDQGRISVKKSILFRLLSIRELRKVVKQATKENKFIIFNNVSPALFSFGIWNPSKSAITFDWTRTLYDQVLGKKIRKGIIFRLHKMVLTRSKCLICWTDAVIENLTTIYGVNQTNIYKAPAPLLVEKMKIRPRPTPNMPKVLFVGGDLIRKGGDVILSNWEKMLRGRCILTMMTNDNSAKVEGINFLSGVKYGSEVHKEAFRNHDILILPTRIDAYPQVIGEAAASGMAVITTKFALGSKEILTNGENGFICDKPEECIDQLLNLIDDIELIDRFKNNAYHAIHQKFSKENIRERYLLIINQFGNS